jgi:hypothetical protein
VHLEVHVEPQQPGRQSVDPVGASAQHAGVVVDGFQLSPAFGNPGGDHRDRRVQDVAGLVALVAPRRVGLHGELGDVAGREARARGGARLHAVDAEVAPVLAVDVEGHQIPALSGVDEAVRFDVADALSAVVRPVFEADALVVAGGGGDDGQRLGVDGGAAAGRRHGDGLQGVDPGAQPGRQHLFQFGERSDRAFLDAGDGAAGGGAQADGHGDRLLVVQKQRWHLGASAQLVPAGHAGGGVDGVAQRAQLVDVAADGAYVHLKAVGQVGAGPFAVGL